MKVVAEICTLPYQDHHISDDRSIKVPLPVCRVSGSAIVFPADKSPRDESGWIAYLLIVGRPFLVGVYIVNESFLHI